MARLAELVQREFGDLLADSRRDAALALRPQILPNVFPIPSHGLFLDLPQMRVVDFVGLLNVGPVPIRIACFVSAKNQIGGPPRIESKQNAIRLAAVLDP